MQSCIDICFACARQCQNCATACLHEDDVKMMRRCIELDLECAEMCYASARLMGIGGEHAAVLCIPCAEVCEVCAEECGKHEMAHCRECAEMCRRCAEECRAMVGVNA